MARYFVPFTIEELKAKIDEAIKKHPEYGDDPEDWCRYNWRTLTGQIEKDLKVEFDFENCEDNKQMQYDQTGMPTDQLANDPDNVFLGYNVLPNGMPFRGIWAGGDWECPVAFIIYWDGSKLRAYVPTDGNSWNTDTKRAYGNEEKDGEDLKNMKKRWPEQYAEVEEADGGNAPEFNWELIFADIQARIIKK